MGGSFSPLQRLLITVGGALLLPALAVLILQVVNNLQAEKVETERAALARAEEIINLADARIAAEFAAVRVLATSATVEHRDWRGAYERARSVLAYNPAWKVVTLVDAETGAVILDTRRPFGPRTPGAPGAPPAERIGGVELEGGTCPCVFLEAPTPAAPGYVMKVGLDPEVFQTLLMRRMPQGAVAAIVDREGDFIARSLDLEQRIGTPATTYVRQAVAQGGKGLYRGVTYEGFENFTAYASSDLTGWSAHVALDRKLVDAPARRTATAIVAGAIVAAAAAALLIAYALVDLAARRREEERLVQLQKAEAIGQFTSGVAHDFSNLLMVVIGNLERIAGRSTDPESVKSAERALGAARRGARISNQLLSFARQDGAEIKPVDLAALFERTDELMRETAGAGVAVSYSVAPSGRWVLANADQLELALMNLIINARDAMNGEGAVTVSAAQAGDSVEIRVADTGPGVPPRLRARLFEPFFTTKPPGKGTGLGLAQVSGAARQAGGSVDVDEAPEGGAVFVLRLRPAPPPA